MMACTPPKRRRGKLRGALHMPVFVVTRENIGARWGLVVVVLAELARLRSAGCHQSQGFAFMISEITGSFDAEDCQILWKDYDVEGLRRPLFHNYVRLKVLFIIFLQHLACGVIQMYAALEMALLTWHGSGGTPRVCSPDAPSTLNAKS